MKLKSNRPRILKSILSWPLLAFILIEGEITHAARGRRAQIAVVLLLLNAFVFPRLGYTPVRWAEILRVVLGIGSICLWPLCVFIQHGLTIAFSYVLGCWLLALVLTLRFAFKNLLALPELHETGIRPGSCAGENTFLIHTTDIHVTVADNVARWDGGRGGSGFLAQLVQICAHLHPTHVCISGDMVDTGHQREWMRFQEQIQVLKRSSVIIMAPGNHDLSQHYGEVDHGKARNYIVCQSRLTPQLQTMLGTPVSSLLDLAKKEVESKLESTFTDLLVANRHFNRFGYVAQFFGLPVEYYIRKANLFKEKETSLSGESQLDFPTEDIRRSYVVPDWLRLPEDFDWRALALEILVDEWFEEKWDSLFPLSLSDHSSRSVFFVLNSNPQSTISLTDSAVGATGEEQLQRLKGLITNLPADTTNVIMISHHTPFRRPGEWQLPIPRPLHKISGWKRAFQVISELAFLPHDPTQARTLLNLLAKEADQHSKMNFILLTGHRHRYSVGRVGRALAVEGDSLADGGAVSSLHLSKDDVFYDRKQIADDQTFANSS